MNFLLSRGKTNGNLKFQLFLVSAFGVIGVDNKTLEQNNLFLQCLYGKYLQVLIK